MQRSFFLVIVCLALWITACQTSISVTAVPAPTFVVFMPTETSAPVSTLVMEQPIFAATATITGTPYPTRTPGVEAERSTPTRGPRPTGLVVITATPVVPPFTDTNANPISF